MDNDVDVTGNRLRLFFAVYEMFFSNVAAAHHNFMFNESLERATVTFAPRIKRGGGDDAVPETRLRFLLRAGAHGDINLPNIRKAVQQHAERDFPEKARTLNQEDFSILVNFRR